jgi:DNA-binding MarR family transcriptional regulator
MRAYTRVMDSPCYCAALRAATRRLGAAYDAALEPFGINIAQFSLMRNIARRQSISLTDLGKMLELDRSTIGRNVRVLERSGLVTSGRGADDQREAIVSLTKRGLRVLDDAGPAWMACQREIEVRIGKKRVSDLRNILEAV